MDLFSKGKQQQMKKRHLPADCNVYTTELPNLTHSHPIKIDLNKKLNPKQKTIQTFNIDAKRFRKINENPLAQKIGVDS